jgi:sugar phosphate isomerase/epimerase
MNIADRIGVSTISMTGVDVTEAIRMIAERGFKTIEIWAADFQGVAGYPLQPAAGIWPRTCPPEKRNKIRGMLAPFETVIIHVQLYGTDICAINPGIREESRRQYRECLELGEDLGASHVTYHAGSQGNVLGADGPERARRAREHNLSMARELIDRSEDSGILMGYENGPIRGTLDLVEAVERDRFGLLLDIPHAAMAADFHGTDGIIDDMGLCRGKLVEVHAHGLWADVCVLRDHQDMHKNNCLDYSRLMPKLREINYRGPVVFEVCAPDAVEVVARCVEFKNHLVKCWNESGYC